MPLSFSTINICRFINVPFVVQSFKRQEAVHDRGIATPAT